MGINMNEAGLNLIETWKGPWLTYQEASEYTKWSVPYLRNLVNAGKIPVYGSPRVRRFRKDMLDLFVTNRDVAMRKFREERRLTHVSN